LALVLIGFAADEAKAQVVFGAHASWASEVDLGIGARAAFELPVENLSIVPSLDIFFPGSPAPGVSNSWMELNGNVHYSFPLENNPKFLPYAGGGLNFTRQSVKFGGISESATKVGLNLLGGMHFGSWGSVRPFAELRYATVYTGQLIISGGINF
jgi:opacity protein-like surface antigen